ncbi:hypothetical protein M407DRAFT_233617 [Tulasnella calospora MUT 4182]|uniref:Zn(2)-C6 fungal-type domain-containing protein n=1 Tax=Tulasnella calospora MUT 4182 TaxID=1051891 RepID=A0A0C3QKW1_9AGAM|nr:hypothetical protein M407DRAFT_233617 [Tulasnella calospora MUT 4182]
MPPNRTAPPESSVGPIRHPKGISRVNKNQATACASCRSRRVKCDRKKPQPGEPSTSTPPCSECYQRGFQCVDEIRDVKQPKMLRRGRKIQELERIFGVPQNERWSVSPEPTLERYAPPPPSAVPMLEMPFFNSKFYRRFHVQRPIVDPVEFVERFQRHINQGVPLGIFGELIAKLLATWAASYGVNVRGEEEPHDGLQGVERRRAATNIMVHELLATIDRHAVMRSISWDGVRALLLLIPLTEEVQSDADRATMYQSTVLQVYSLSTMSDSLQRNETGGQVDQMVRARIFWYGHVHEGLTNGLKGKKLIFDQDDVDAFKSPLSVRDYSTALAKSPVTSSLTFQFATAPIRLSAACRLVNATLTGPKADRAETVDRLAMDRVWTALAACWDEFENLRSLGGTAAMQNEETDRFISGWQIFIFEALNVVRERLQDRISRIRNSRIVPTDGGSPSHKLTDLEHLHDIAESRCQDVLPQVMELIRRHVGTAFFEYDASLCRDGVYYAGERIAGEPNSGNDVHICLKALSQMRWAYSKSTQRTEKLKSIWQNRQAAVAPLPPAPGRTPPSSHPILPPRSHPVPVPPSGGTAGPIFDPLDVDGPPPFNNTSYPVPGADNVRHIPGSAASFPPALELMYHHPSGSSYNGPSQANPSLSGPAGIHHHAIALPALVKPDPAALDYSYGPASQVHSLDPLPLPRLQNSVKPGPPSPTSPLTMSFAQSSYSTQPQMQPSYGYGSSSIPQRGYIDSAMGSYYTNPGVSDTINLEYFPEVLHFDATPLEPQDMRPSLARTVTSASGHLQISSQTGTPPHYSSGVDIPYDPSLNSTSAHPPASSVPSGHSFYPS